MKRKVTWVVTNMAVLAGVYFGLFKGVEWAANLAVFWLWLNAFMSTVAAFHEESRNKIRAKGFSVPLWLSVGADIVLVSMLASTAHFLLAVVTVWQMCCESHIFGEEADHAK